MLMMRGPAGLLLLLFAGCAGMGPSDRPAGVGQMAKSSQPEVEPKIASAYEAALSAMRKGNDAAAEKGLLQLAEQYPEFSGPHTNLGIINFRAGNMDKATAEFQTALKLNPNNVVSLNYLGIINRERGTFKEAYGFYERALQIDPDYAYAHRNFGILLDLYMGRSADALEHYKRYQELSKEDDAEVKKWIVDLSRRVKK
jgi:tetratricopeptide (TPR) repeat protein